MESFEELQVQQEIIHALNDAGITAPTLIQQKAIPLIKQGRDVIGISKTGSGKTAAFGIPLLEKIAPDQGIQVLIVAPTRELVVQIADEFRALSSYRRCRITSIFGGVSLGPQIEQLRRAEIVAGTPGRLLDHLQRGTIDFSRLRTVVLDEADKMVEMGFIDDVHTLLDHTPQDRQLLLFGATLSAEIDQLVEQYMRDAVTAEAERQVQQDLLQQYYYQVQQHEKFSLLCHLLHKADAKRVIIFSSTRSTVDLLTRNLRVQGIAAAMMHGKLGQQKRLQVINNFREGRPPILVASAVAARGLHIDDVTHVINYDLSNDPREYLHRVGRTARAGAAGKAITLLGPRDYEAFNAILGLHRLSVEELPQEEFPRLRFDARRMQMRSGPAQRSRYPVRRGQWHGRPRSFSFRGERRSFA